MRTAIALFTRDLRVRDNPVLAGAHAAADRVVPLFVLDDAVLLTSHGRPNRFGFLAESLRDLDQSLRERGGALFMRRGDWVGEVLRVAKEGDATTIHVARDVSRYAQARLARLQASAPIDVTTHDSITVVPPAAFGKPFVVFTPYYNRWLDTSWREIAPLPRRLSLPEDIEIGVLPRGASPDGWQGGETRRPGPHEGVDAPRSSGLLRPARRPRRRRDVATVAVSALRVCLGAGGREPFWDRAGSTEFLRQLCWRDFYAQLLSWRPALAHDDLRPRSAPVWRNAPGDLEAWKAGRTGFPFVDAGMRQLRAEGWMHNRVRMVAASFLTRDLRIDWREGARHFMDLLVDGDVANNQLNWQWVAGTGTDVNPHRVLNPTLQGRNHDPGGVYVRRWIRELRDVAPDVDIHDPAFDVRRATRYPEPVIDHHEAIEMWRASRR